MFSLVNVVFSPLPLITYELFRRFAVVITLLLRLRLAVESVNWQVIPLSANWLTDSRLYLISSI